MLNKIVYFVHNNVKGKFEKDDINVEGGQDAGVAFIVRSLMNRL